jgi:thioredoxin 1
MRDVTDESFQRDVLEADKPVIVDFWAPWCGPCRALEPILAELEREHEAGVTFAKLNIDENIETASRYSVLSIPTAILFEGGNPQETVIGARPRAHYERAWAAWFGTKALARDADLKDVPASPGHPSNPGWQNR